MRNQSPDVVDDKEENTGEAPYSFHVSKIMNDLGRFSTLVLVKICREDTNDAH